MNRLQLLCLLLCCVFLTATANAAVSPTEKPNFNPVTDTIPPEIICPPNLTFDLSPGICDSIIQYIVEATDDQGQVILIHISGLTSGSSFPVGTTVTTYLATDLEGNTATCSFSVQLNETGNGTLQCQDLVQVYFDNDCNRTVLPIDVLEPNSYGCLQNYYVELDKTLPFGNGPWVPAILSVADVNKTYQARVTLNTNGNKCWGNITVKDTTPPFILVETINVPCILPLAQLTPSYLKDSFGILPAMPIVSDACTVIIDTVTFLDIQQNFPCDDTTTISGIIRRLWTAVDGSGNISTVEQRINRNRLLSDIQFPAGKSTDCKNPDLSVITNGRPFIQYSNRIYELSPSSYCEFDAQYVDSIQAGSCPGNYTVKRTWKVYDACLPFSASNPKTGIQNILVEDLAGPQIQCPDDLTITVTANNCQAAVDLPDAFLSDNCSGLYSLQAFWSDNNGSNNIMGNIEYPMDSSGVDSLGVFGMVQDFPVGTTTVLYVAEDSCGNTGDCSFQLTLADMVPPIALCDTAYMLSLPSFGFTMIAAESLNNGSTDDCAPLHFKVKLTLPNTCHPDTLFSDSLNICCQNRGDTLSGILRVYDISMAQGLVQDSLGAGHFSDCQFNIFVSGINLPSCTVSPDVMVACEAFDPTLESYGGLTFQSCSVDSLLEIVDYSQFDSLCSRGTIIRTFTVSDSSGQSSQCVQTIVVNFEQDYFIRFPDDVIVTICDGTNNYGQPIIYGEDCEDMIITFTDQIFTIVPDACLKTERTWKIYNSCTYDINGPTISIPNPTPSPISNHPSNLPGPIISPIQTAGDPWASTIEKINPTDPNPTNYSIYFDYDANAYSYKQIIKIIDVQAPLILDCSSSAATIQDSSNNDAQMWNSALWWDVKNQSHDLCEAPSEICITATDLCTGSNINIEYQLFLDLDDNGVLETVVNSTQLGFQPGGLGWNNILFGNFTGPGQSRLFDHRPVTTNQKWGFAIQETVSGNNKTACVKFNTQAAQDSYATPLLPHGKHKIKWFVSDGCGNEKTCEQEILIRDGKPPVVICLNGLSVNILSNGSFTLFDTDFLQYTEDNCTPNAGIVLGIRKEGAGSGFPVDPDGNPLKNLVYTCPELGSQPIELWAKDVAGNAGFCTTSVIIQDGSSFCGGPNSLSGLIKTELDEGMGDVKLFTGSGFPVPPTQIAITDSTGFYALPGNIPGSLIITPEYDENPLNGVTTYDLVLISKHILGIEALGSPYKMIAADANKSNSITTFDIVTLRKLILGIDQTLSFNTSWRFVQKGYVFPNPSNPFGNAFPETMLASDLIPGQTNWDFVGIKIGDVNNTAVAPAIGPADDRNAGTAFLDISSSEAETLEPGSITTIQVKAAAPLIANQFTLELNGLELLEIIPGENMTADHFAAFPEEGALTVAWDESGLASFSLVCRATKAANIREMIALSSRITKAAAYREVNQQVLQYDLALRFPAAAAFELYQNQPNPFSSSTNISFNLPEASQATLKIMDANGRLIYSRSDYYESGMHTISLQDAALGVKGVLYYQVETPLFSGTKKMVRI